MQQAPSSCVLQGEFDATYPGHQSGSSTQSRPGGPGGPGGPVEPWQVAQQSSLIRPSLQRFAKSRHQSAISTQPGAGVGPGGPMDPRQVAQQPANTLESPHCPRSL